MASSSQEESSSSTSSSSTPTPTIEELVHTQVNYMKLIAGHGEDAHIFIVDETTVTQFSKAIDELVKIGRDLNEMSHSPSSSSSKTTQYETVEFRELPWKAVENCVRNNYWKKRWRYEIKDSVVSEPMPPGREEALWSMIAANELRA